MPVPLLGHLPNGHSGILLFTGDEDGSEQSANEEQMRLVESHGGRMSLYVIPDMTSIDRGKIAAYRRRGHEVSVHPNLRPTCGRPPAGDSSSARGAAASPPHHHGAAAGGCPSVRRFRCRARCGAWRWRRW